MLRHHVQKSRADAKRYDGPKGFAVLEALTGDVRLREALRLAGDETMEEM